ncbi:MAG: SUMF1/EgtB/PvdO family nonheme iron enzyme, partial [bacterium]
MPAKKRKLCFVLMPFKDEMKEVYRKAIKPACEQAGFNCLRVDELKGAFNINRKIIQHIFTSDAIVADLTDRNPNVFYEMGVAHAIDNKTIMIIQKKDPMPFDVSTYHSIQYEQSEVGLEKLKRTISDFLLCIDDWRREPTNPVQDFKPDEEFIPKSTMTEFQELLKEKEKLLANSMPRSEWESLQRELTKVKKELQKRPQVDEISALKKELERVRSQLKAKEQQIKVIQDEADKKKAIESQLITPPPGMALIPAGEFEMGTSAEQIEKYLKDNPGWKREWIEGEKPAHKVWVDAFFMDIYLVTNGKYAEFLNEWGKAKDENDQLMIEDHEWGVRQVKNRWEPRKGFENHPVVNVTWYG